MTDTNTTTDPWTWILAKAADIEGEPGAFDSGMTDDETADMMLEDLPFRYLRPLLLDAITRELRNLHQQADPDDYARLMAADIINAKLASGELVRNANGTLSDPPR